MQATGDWIWCVSPFLLMLALTALNHMIIHQRTERRYAIEAERLRSAIVAELRVLHELYLSNLKSIEDDANYVLSTHILCSFTREILDG